MSAVIGSWKIGAISLPRSERSVASSTPRSSRPSSLIDPVTRAFSGSRPEQRHRARALAGAGLADDGEHLAAADDVVHVDRGGVELALDPELDAEVVDLEDRLGQGLVRRRDLGVDARRVSHSVCPICEA